MRKLLYIVTMLAMTGTLAWAAEEPASRDRGARSEPPRRDGESSRRGEMDRPRPLRNQARIGDMPTEEQWREAVEFMREYSGNRWGTISGPAGERPMVRRRIWARYEHLQRLREEDPRLYELRLEQLRLEDQVFGLVNEFHHATSEEQSGEVRARLRGRIGEWVRHGLDERQRRIDRLQRLLEEERARLEADEKRVDALIDERLNDVLAGRTGALEEGDRPSGFADEPAPEGRRGPGSSPGRGRE